VKYELAGLRLNLPQRKRELHDAQLLEIRGREIQEMESLCAMALLSLPARSRLERSRYAADAGACG
jgi:hypothetical protein